MNTRNNTNDIHYTCNNCNTGTIECSFDASEQADVKPCDKCGHQYNYEELYTLDKTGFGISWTFEQT